MKKFLTVLVALLFAVAVVSCGGGEKKDTPKEEPGTEAVQKEMGADVEPIDEAPADDAPAEEAPAEEAPADSTAAPADTTAAE